MVDPGGSGGRRRGAPLARRRSSTAAAHRAADVVAVGLCVLGAISPLALAYGLVAWQAGMSTGLAVLLGVAAVLTAWLLVILLWPRRRTILGVGLVHRCPHCRRPTAAAASFRSLDGHQRRADTLRRPR